TTVRLSPEAEPAFALSPVLGCRKNALEALFVWPV
ncbi:MAG: hypothetical protein ACI9B9_002725, partial [Halioglobus sp.]